VAAAVTLVVALVEGVLQVEVVLEAEGKVVVATAVAVQAVGAQAVGAAAVAGRVAAVLAAAV
jgi:hypothetical protein